MHQRLLLKPKTCLQTISPLGIWKENAINLLTRERLHLDSAENSEVHRKPELRCEVQQTRLAGHIVMQLTKKRISDAMIRRNLISIENSLTPVNDD